MRCEGCDGKFGSNGEPDVEVDSHDYTTSDNISVETKVSVPCANCGSDFKEGYLSFDVDVASQHDCEQAPEDPTGTGDDIQFEIGAVDATVDDDYRPKTREVKDRKTGEVKQVPVPMRAQRHYYDVTLTISVTCGSCSEEFEVTTTDSLGAGEMEAA
jgi:hypothetical protein